jgi:hypothetical protein
MCGKADGSSNI